MGLPDRELPSTLLDFFAKVEPELAKFAQSDANALATSGYAPGFLRLEDVPTGFFDFVSRRVEAGIARHARSEGIAEGLAGTDLSSALGPQRANYEQLGMLYHLILSFHLGGAKIFRIASSLAERLYETDIDVPASELKLPFPTLMLVYDDDVSFQAFHQGSPFGKAPYRGSLSTVLVDVPAPDGDRLLAATLHHRGCHTHGMIHRSMRYGEGSLKAMLATAWPGDPAREPDAPGQAFNRLILNTILYISSRDGRVGPETKTVGRPAPLVKSQLVHRVVGAGLVPMRRLAGVTHAQASLNMGRQLNSRHVVRGHWKLQAHGAQGSSRKLVWVEPYVRGPKLGELLNRPRLVS